MDKAKIAYDVLHAYTGGRNIFRGELLPSWESLDRIQRNAIEAAIAAVTAAPEPEAPPAPAPERKTKKGA